MESMLLQVHGCERISVIRNIPGASNYILLRIEVKRGAERHGIEVGLFDLPEKVTAALIEALRDAEAETIAA